MIELDETDAGVLRVLRYSEETHLYILCDRANKILGEQWSPGEFKNLLRDLRRRLPAHIKLSISRYNAVSFHVAKRKPIGAMCDRERAVLKLYEQRAVDGAPCPKISEIAAHVGMGNSAAFHFEKKLMRRGRLRMRKIRKNRQAFVPGVNKWTDWTRPKRPAA